MFLVATYRRVTGLPRYTAQATKPVSSESMVAGMAGTSDFTGARVRNFVYVGSSQLPRARQMEARSHVSMSFQCRVSLTTQHRWSPAPDLHPPPLSTAPERLLEPRVAILRNDLCGKAEFVALSLLDMRRLLHKATMASRFIQRVWSDTIAADGRSRPPGSEPTCTQIPLGEV
jgi:hypothetical protein